MQIQLRKPIEAVKRRTQKPLAIKIALSLAQRGVSSRLYIADANGTLKPKTIYDAKKYLERHRRMGKIRGPLKEKSITKLLRDKDGATPHSRSTIAGLISRTLDRLAITRWGRQYGQKIVDPEKPTLVFGYQVYENLIPERNKGNVIDASLKTRRAFPEDPIDINRDPRTAIKNERHPDILSWEFRIEETSLGNNTVTYVLQVGGSLDKILDYAKQSRRLEGFKSRTLSTPHENP